MEFTQNDVEELKQEVEQYKQGKMKDYGTIKTLKENLHTSEKVIKDLEKEQSIKKTTFGATIYKIIGMEVRPTGKHGSKH